MDNLPGNLCQKIFLFRIKKKIQNPQPSETEQRTLISSSRRSHENETRNSQSRLVSRNLKQGPCLDSWPSTGAEKQTYFGSKLEGRFFWFDYPQSTCRQEGRSTELKIFSCFNSEARKLGRHIVPIWQRPGQVPYKNLKIALHKTMHNELHLWNL